MADLRRLLEPLQRAIKLMASKGVVEAVDDSTAMQTVQVTVGKDELLDKVERVQPFGLTSVPAAGDEAVVVLLGGERGQAVVVALDSSSKRPTGLAEGEVAVYRDASNYVKFLANGDVDVTVDGTAKVQAAAIELGTTAAVKALVNDTFHALFNAHTHSGVTAGAGVTGAPVIPLPATVLTTKTKAE